MAVASSAQEHGAEVISRGTIGTRPWDLDHLIRTLPSKATQLVLVSDAGPCGDWLSRDLTQRGYGCWGVAPSLMPQTAGDRVNTDRRDAVPLARLMRSGALTPVDVPQVDEEAIRDLRRAREDTLRDRKAAKLRRNACWLRHAIRSTGRATWGPAHLRWLSEVVCPPPAQPLVFQESSRTGTEHTERRQRLDQALHDQVKAWRLAPVVDALRALRGVQCTVAVTMVAAWGDLTRVDHPRQLMSDLGLTPSEYSSGERRRQGAITTAGNSHARRALIAGAWASRSPANVSRPLQWRLEKVPTTLQDIRWKAQVRLGQRYRHLSVRGQQAHQVVVAMAREVIAFMWAMARPISGTPESRVRRITYARVHKGSHRHRQRRRPGVGSSSVA